MAGPVRRANTFIPSNWSTSPPGGASGWPPQVGRGQLVMEDAFRRVLARLPFPVLQIHPDNGSEFLNQHLLRFWRDRVPGVRLSRSRPYQKNDNPRVEQKNYTLVRAYLGDARLDTVAQTLALNQIYDLMWLPQVQLFPTGAAPGGQDHRAPGRRHHPSPPPL